MSKRSPELRFVDAGEIGRLTRELPGLQNHGAAELSQRLDHVDAGQHRIAGKVAGEDLLVVRYVFVSSHPNHRFELENSVDQQHRVPMR